MNGISQWQKGILPLAAGARAVKRSDLWVTDPGRGTQLTAFLHDQRRDGRIGNSERKNMLKPSVMTLPSSSSFGT